MAEITLIEPQKKDKERCNVYVDGVFYCGIKLEVAVKYRLKTGMQIEKSRLDEIQLETEKSQALDKAMNFISAAMKTKKQVRDYLDKKGYTQAVADFVIEKLEYYKFLDDYAYCRAYVAGVSGKGKRAIENADAALAVLTKYMRGKESTKENLYKGFKYLLSKGYGYDTAKSALSGFGVDDEDY